MDLMIFPVAIAWFISLVLFVRLRSRFLAAKGLPGSCDHADWAVRLYTQLSSSVVLAFILLAI